MRTTITNCRYGTEDAPQSQSGSITTSNIMCTSDRSHQEIMHQQLDHTAATKFTARIPTPSAAHVYDSTSTNDAGSKNGGIFHSPTARAILAVSSIALLFISVISMGNNHAADVKDLSDTVMSLTRQLQNLEVANENKEHELENLAKQVNDKDIELGWEAQHVESQKEIQELMQHSLVDTINEDHKVIKEAYKFNYDMSHTSELLEKELVFESAANLDLKLELASALEELESVRKQLPGGNRGGEGENNESKLRGASPYQPGDNIDIIEDEEGGKVALHPGVVTEVNTDGTFNVVNLGASVLLRNRKAGELARYKVYEAGSSAFYQEARDVFSPITIIKFINGRARPGFEIHGSYQFYYDNSSQRSVQEKSAMRIHRYAYVGEIIGGETWGDAES